MKIIKDGKKYAKWTGSIFSDQNLKIRDFFYQFLLLLSFFLPMNILGRIKHDELLANNQVLLITRYRFFLSRFLLHGVHLNQYLSTFFRSKNP